MIQIELAENKVFKRIHVPYIILKKWQKQTPIQTGGIFE
jgi:hypothetical protein